MTDVDTAETFKIGDKVIRVASGEPGVVLGPDLEQPEQTEAAAERGLPIRVAWPDTIEYHRAAQLRHRTD